MFYCPSRLAAACAASLLALAATVSSSTFAQYPARAITMVVPQAVGGTNDIIGRLVALKLGEALNGSVVVENRRGAGGNFGTAHVSKAPRDGYTLMMTVSSAQAINPALYKSVGFDPVKDFTPISLIGTVPNVLVVIPSFPARTMKEFIEVTRAKPEFYQYASAGNGTLNHLLGEMLGSYAGVQLQHVPYKGIAPALNDVIGGQAGGARREFTGTLAQPARCTGDRRNPARLRRHLVDCPVRATWHPARNRSDLAGYDEKSARCPGHEREARRARRGTVQRNTGAAGHAAG